MRDLKKLHAHNIKTGLANDPIAASRVLVFCATNTSGDLNYAIKLFDKIPQPNLFTWNTIIRGFANSSNPRMAICIFIDMLVGSTIEPQRLTYPSVFKAYSQLGLARDGAQLHGRVIKQGLQFDHFIWNTIMNMYANCGFLSEAWKLFDEDGDFDIVTWNSMIMGLCKSGEIDSSKKLFDKMPLRNSISWNSMISGYVRNGKWAEALDLFNDMQMENVNPSKFTMVSLLNASARLGALKQGEWAHEYITRNKMEMNLFVVTAIIDMYCKCGSINKALQVFETAPVRGLSCWNSIILGLATNGRGGEALDFFSSLELSEHEPDSVSFIGVLTACNHSGMVTKAREYFTLMTEKYKIEPSLQHYGCLADVLGRAGLVEEAAKVIRNMPMDPDAIMFSTLLSACCKCRNAKIGKWAAKNLLELDPNEAAAYLGMTKFYSESGDFENAVKERASMKEMEIEKQPGCSLVEVDGVVHEFVAGGRLHPQIQEIFMVSNELRYILQEPEPLLPPI